MHTPSPADSCLLPLLALPAPFSLSHILRITHYLLLFLSEKADPAATDSEGGGWCVPVAGSRVRRYGSCGETSAIDMQPAAAAAAVQQVRKERRIVKGTVCASLTKDPQKHH